MRKTLAILAMAAIGGSVSADASDLYISEVFEGTSGNLKYVEIYNNGGTAVDLDTPADVIMRRYSNANTTSTDFDLTGTVPAGGFFVVANNSTDHEGFFAAADQYTTGIVHNGNDKYELFDSTGSTVIDAFAADLIGGSDNFAIDAVAYRLNSALPNSGDWGDTNQPADGADSFSGAWRVFTVTASNGNASTVGTPGTNSGIEAPTVSVSDWTLY